MKVLVACRVCDPRMDAPEEFGTERAATDWAVRHRSDTGHDSWAASDDPEEFARFRELARRDVEIG